MIFPRTQEPGYMQHKEHIQEPKSRATWRRCGMHVIRLFGSPSAGGEEVTDRHDHPFCTSTSVCVSMHAEEHWGRRDMRINLQNAVFDVV